MPNRKPPNSPPIKGRTVRGIRSPIPSGYMLGRTSSGDGPVEVLPMSSLIASPAFVQSQINKQAIIPGSAAGGDLTGTFPNPTVAKIRGNSVIAGIPPDGWNMRWVNANSDWEYKPPFGHIVIDGTDVYYAAVTSLADPELVFSGGQPVYVKNPAIPNKAKFYWRLHLSGNQSITAGVDTVIAFDTVDVDPQNWADISVNKGRVTPKVAGRYQVAGLARVGCTTGPVVGGNLAAGRIFLNGSAVSSNVERAQVASLSNPVGFAFIVDIVTVNGTTDYIELAAECDGTTVVVDGTPGQSYFSGTYLGP